MTKNKWPYLLLILLLSALSFYFYRDSIYLFPSFIHAWTQSDRYALCLAFLNHGMNLFMPRTFNLMTIDGITGVDLPVHEYIVAWIMKITGNHGPGIFRITTLLYSFIGYLFLYRLTRLFTTSVLRSLLVVLFTFTLPVIVYYQAGFVPSVPAMANVFIAYYFYFRYQKQEKSSDFLLAIAFLTLASLERAPYNIFLFATFLQQVYRAWSLKKINFKEVGAYAIAYALIFGFLGYKTYLNATYGSMFLTEIMPARSLEEFKNILTAVAENWQWAYFTAFHYILLALVLLNLILFVVRRSSIPRQIPPLALHTLLILGGASAYLLLMMRQFPDHDYYFIDSFYPGIVFFFILGMSCFPSQNRIARFSFGGLCILLLLFASAYSKNVQDERYTFHFWDRGEITHQNFEGSEAWLDSMGVPKSATVLVIDAYSTNAPLILMNHRGYTVQNTTKENILKGLQQKADFIVIQDRYLPSDVYYNYPGITNHLKRIGGNGYISLFQYTEHPLQETLESMLGVPKNATVYTKSFDADSIDNAWQYQGLRDSSISFSKPNAAVVEASDEFGPAVEIPIADSLRLVLFKGRFLANKVGDFLTIAASIQNGTNQLSYQSVDVQFHKAEKWIEYACAFQVPKSLPPASTIKCFIYNTHHIKVWVDDLSVKAYSPN